MKIIFKAYGSKTVVQVLKDGKPIETSEPFDNIKQAQKWAADFKSKNGVKKNV